MQHVPFQRAIYGTRQERGVFFAISWLSSKIASFFQKVFFFSPHIVSQHQDTITYSTASVLRHYRSSLFLPHHGTWMQRVNMFCQHQKSTKTMCSHAQVDNLSLWTQPIWVVIHWAYTFLYTYQGLRGSWTSVSTNQYSIYSSAWYCKLNNLRNV